MVLHVSSGWAKALPLKTVAGVRPTKNVARQALFDILRPKINEMLFIDLFAGSGAIGIEALANDALGCIFVERNRRVVQMLRKNLFLLRGRATAQGLLLGKVVCYQLAVGAFLQRFSTNEAVLVWADPPYSDCLHWYGEFIKHLRVGAGSYLCMEMPAKQVLPASNAWRSCRSKRYGDTRITVLCRE